MTIQGDNTFDWVPEQSCVSWPDTKQPVHAVGKMPHDYRWLLDGTKVSRELDIRVLQAEFAAIDQ
jgi:hypothetical protein